MGNQGSSSAKFVDRFGFRLLGLIVLAYVFATSDWGAIKTQFGGLSFANLVLALFLVAPGVGLKAWRWQRMLRHQKIDYPFFRSLAVYLYSTSLGFLSPGRLGEFSRIVIVGREKNQPLVIPLAGFAAERILDLSLIGSIFAWGFGFYALKWSYWDSLLLSVAVSGIGGGLFFLFVRFFSLNFMGYKIALFIKDLKILLAPGKGIPLLFPTVLSAVILFWQYDLLADALHLDLHFLQVAFSICLVSLVSILPTILGRDSIRIILINRGFISL